MVDYSRRRSSGVLKVLVGVCLVGCLAEPTWNGTFSAGEPKAQAAQERRADVRNAKWATPVELAGAPNLHRVSKHLCRSAQPSAEGMRGLKKMGIKTIVNLRGFHSDRDEIGDTEIDYEHIAMAAWHAKDKHVVRFLKIVTDKKKTPVLVHCWHGSDRTGLMCAIYRIVVQGWSKKEALDEMINGGFGYHKMWKNLKEYIEKLDVKSIKRQAGLGQG